MQEYKVIGIMSGTSLDGVDLAYCYFSKDDSAWKFEIRNSETIPYSKEWKERLSSLHEKDAITLAQSHAEYGTFLGALVKKFADENRLIVDFVSSHGHTIFHQPQNKFTFQLGDGAALSAASGFPVICDFRSKDIAAGGQGAPLVPIGDRLLFAEYDYCLNLGGIANISFEKNQQRIAYDICACNIVLNSLAGKLGKEYDDNGAMANRGKVNEQLLKQLNELFYYKKLFPKSLGRENIDRDIFPIINASPIFVEDKLKTFCEHIAIQIGAAVGSWQSAVGSRLLISGGGTFNGFLVSRIKELSKVQIVVPEKKIINNKEALIFAFLGVLRMRGEVNCLKSVTGAISDSIGGAVYFK